MNLAPYHNIAEIYDAIRPSYPKDLIVDSTRNAGLSSDSVIMEIAAGTGKATEHLLSLGCEVDAVEMEPAMAELMQRKLCSPKLHIYISPFESWEPSRKNYDAICCAQGFHWLDPKVKFKRCRELLSLNGSLILIWYDPMPGDSECQKDADAVYARFLGERERLVTAPADSRELELMSTDLFSIAFQRKYHVVLRNTADQALLAMHSTPAFQAAFSALSPADQTAFETNYREAIERHGGTLDSLMLYSLYILKLKTNHTMEDIEGMECYGRNHGNQ